MIEHGLKRNGLNYALKQAASRVVHRYGAHQSKYFESGGSGRSRAEETVLWVGSHAEA